jgi:hypothetical protein
MQNSYLRLETDPATGRRHPLLAGLEEAPRIINGVWRLEVQPAAGLLPPPLTLIPAYPDLPTEKVYPRALQTSIPGVCLRPGAAGQGRVVYFPWDIDRVFWEVLCVDHGKLLRNAVLWATADEAPVTVTGPGVLDVTLWRQAHSMTVHLVNLTNPMMMKGPFRELLPVGAQQVRVRLPAGLQPRKVHLLVAGATPRWTTSRGWLALSVPSILDHEVVAIDF